MLGIPAAEDIQASGDLPIKKASTTQLPFTLEFTTVPLSAFALDKNLHSHTDLGDKGAAETLLQNLFASASGSCSPSLHYILYPHCRMLACKETLANWVLVDCDLSMVHGLGSRSSLIRFPTLLHASYCKTQVGDPSLFHVLSFPL